MSSVIFHIDVNSAYLSWSAIENLKNGSDVDLRLIPSIIGGDMSKRHGVVLAKSLPAKAYGIQTGEPVINAFRKCPSLVTERPNHALYSKRSNELMQYLRSVCPDIEQVSIDECYMDFSPIAANYSSPEAAAAEIKNYIRDHFGFTVNVGISDKKVLAKMASDFKKPDLVHTLYSHEIREKMWPLPVSSLYMCGKSSVDTFRRLEILTIGDLAQTDPRIINLHLKSHGQLLWNYANGLDDSVVEPESTDLKGIGNSITLSADALTAADCKKVLLSLSDTVAGRLRSHEQSAGMISTEIKYNTFQSVSHQTTLSTPVCTASLIYETACTLFDEIWDGTPVRLLGIRTSKLSSKDEPVQLSLFDYEEKKPKNEKLEKLDEALFSIRKKYGEGSIVRGSFLNSPDEYKKH
ncbi:MAG: DNA polymerase IV [Lachnospiraceae bacterium]|nr:DNA polymerase IV [Lachnospiraceae bacterium]